MWKKRHHLTYHHTIIGLAGRAILIVLGLWSMPLAQGQSKESLENERKAVIKDIEKTNSYLKNTQKEKTTTLNDISVLNKRAADRKKLISLVKTELEGAEKSLQTNQQRKDSIEQAYVELKEQYKAVLRYNYLQQLSNQKLSYLLSSESLNTFLLRYRYLKQFEAYEKTKKTELRAMQEQITLANQAIAQEKAKKAELLAIESEQYKKLEQEKEEKNKTLSNLSKKESQLKADLKKKQNEREKLNKAIENVILAQLKAAKEKAESSKDPALNKAESKLSDNFSQNKGKLPWPVDRGIVTTKFGKQAHPTLKGITIESNGIDISTLGGTVVRAIFDGNVVGITKVIGSENMLIISHGSFYSVYSNLDQVDVRKGDKVIRGQQVGSALAKEGNKSEIHFELWQNKSKLNPESWLSNR